MSQKKVDAYKQEKANRDKIIKKEKRILLLEKLAGLLVCLIAVGWIGYSVYSKTTGSTETVTQETVMDTSALDNYVSSLTADEETEADVATDTAEDTEEAAEQATDTTTDTEDTAAGTSTEATGTGAASTEADTTVEAK